MRRILAAALLACAPWFAHAAPTAVEQATYNTAEQAVVDAINAYRATKSKPALPALAELCQAARESAEYSTLQVGTSMSSFDRAIAAGFTGTGADFVGAFTVAGHDSPAGLLSYAISNSSYGNYLTDAGAASVGVGIAMRADGLDTEIRVYVIIGKSVGGGLGGTAGIETGSGRGLVDLTQIAAILAGAYTGDSINGFVYDPDAVSPAAAKKFSDALKKLLKKPPLVTTSVGKPVTFKLPPDLFNLVKKFKLKGKLPPGVKFDKKKGGFRGSPSAPGQFSIRIGGDLKGAIDGSAKLKPFLIKFKVGG